MAHDEKPTTCRPLEKLIGSNETFRTKARAFILKAKYNVWLQESCQSCDMRCSISR
jgi:hypothetical protein